MKRKLLSTMFILAIIVVVNMANSNTKQVQAVNSPEISTSGYLNSSGIYLYLGERGNKTYDFNVKKEVEENGANYSWYINKKKGNPASVTINSKTGVVTAREAGTAYITCKIVLADGTELTQEAKVTVRNNITEVKIKNLPEDLTIKAGLAYDFNRVVLNTAADKGAKTQGITRWEITEDTAAVETATAQGVVYPVKNGKFKIRAVCFQSTAKYNLWLTDKEANSALITAASEWSTIKVVSFDGTATASTQEQLNKLLKEDSISTITLSTTQALTFLIPEGDYSKKTLVVNAANADVQNCGVFMEVTINAIKDSTWIEYADGNIFYLNDNVVSLIIDKDVNVKRIVIDTPECTANFEILGTVDEIIVRQPSEVNITGQSSQVPVSVEQSAEGSTITASIPLKLELNAKTDIILNQGAEETNINKSESKVVIKIENNTNKSNVITTNYIGGEIVGAGKIVISDGTVTTNPEPTNTAVTVSGISIEGNALVGATLTATATPEAATGNYQWSSSDTIDGTYTAISGATSSTYVIDAAYAGKCIKATITGTGDYTGTQTSAATKVTVIPLTISAPTLTLTKVYDGNTTAAVTRGVLSGVIGTDDVIVSAAATYNTAAVGTDKTITVVYALSGADAAKYVKPDNYTIATGGITAVSLTASTPTLTQTKAYDGNTTAEVTAGTLHGVVGADDVKVQAIATYDSIEAGTSKTITVVYNLSGAAAGNYVKPANYTVATGTITAAQLTITTPGLTVSKAYDNNITAAIAPGTLKGVVNSDTVIVSAAAAYDTAAIGTGKTITVVYSISGADAANYVKPANYTVKTGVITAAQLTITEPTLTTSKVYDSNTSAAVVPGTLQGIIGSEAVTVSAAATYDTAAVGTGKTITIVYTINGKNAANYQKPVNHTIVTGEITAKQLTFTGNNLTISKTYDGNTNASVSTTGGILHGVIGADDVSVSAEASYNSASVGTGKTITISYTLTGADAGNYCRPVNFTTSMGIISPAPLTAAAPAVSLTKAYDGSTGAAVTPKTLNGVIGTDQVVLHAAATYNFAAVGTGKTITVVYTLSGADAANYMKPTNYTVSTGVITTAQLTITAPTLTASKAYDNNTTAAVTAGSLGGVVGSEAVTVSTVATYDSAAIGTGKTITVVYSIGGADAANYKKPANYTVTTGAITKAQLTITTPTLTKSKVYDGNTSAAVTPGTLQGILGSETVTVSAAATYDTKAAGTGKIITVVYTISGADAANYVKPIDETVSTGEITAKPLTITNPGLVLTKIYDGSPTAAVTAGTLKGVYGTDDVTVTAAATYDTAAAGTGKTITVVYTLSGIDAANYVKPGNSTVTNGEIIRKQLTIGSQNVPLTKEYDGTTSAAVTDCTLSEVIGTDEVTVTATAIYDTAAVGTGKTITVVYTIGGANAANYKKPDNYTIETGAITAAQLTINAPTLTTSKVYDGNTSAVVVPGTLQGKVGSETVTVSAVATYDTAAVGTGKTITVVYTIGGANAANYQKPINHTIVTGEITAKQLTFTGKLTTSKMYDGNTSAVVTLGTLQGILGSDSVTVSAAAAYDTKAAGTGKTITVVYTLSGKDAANYLQPGNATVTNGEITRKQLTVTSPEATTPKVYDGTTNATIKSLTFEGVINSDSVNLLTAATYDTAAVGDGKIITVVYTLSGSDAANYIQPENTIVTNGKITPRQLDIASSFVTPEKLYDGNTRADIIIYSIKTGSTTNEIYNTIYTGTTASGGKVYTIEGVCGVDEITLTATATYDTAAIGTSKTITLSYTISGATAGNYTAPENYITTTGKIRKQLTITPPDLTTAKVYDGNRTAAVTAGDLIGVEGAHEVTVTAVATYDTTTIETGKTITVVYTLSGKDAASYIQPENYIITNGEIKPEK